MSEGNIMALFGSDPKHVGVAFLRVSVGLWYVFNSNATPKW